MRVGRPGGDPVHVDPGDRREGEAEGAADPDLGLEPEPAAEELHDAPAQRQAQSRPLAAAHAAAALLEGLEDALPVLLGGSRHRCR